MKNFIPLLFWTVIGGNILNTDNITHIAPYTDLGVSYSVIFFNNSKNLRVSSIKVNNTSPSEVWEILKKNELTNK
jgi:hypothetical protein